MFNGSILYCCDTETTSLSIEGDVIEISMCRIIINNDGTNSRDQKTWLLKAMNPKEIQDGALAVNGHKREDILHLTKFGKENYLLPEDVVADIELWMMEDGASSVDRVFVGQNPNFDISMMQELWRRCGSSTTFPFSLERGNRIIDTKQIVTLYDVCIGRRRLNYHLGSFVKCFGIKKGKAHQAAEDVRMTTDLLIKLLTPIKGVVTDSFKDCYSDQDEE